jgi:hypothetical protein
MNTTICRLREHFKPERVKVLFVAESPPESNEDKDKVRFFFNPDQERWDYMYRAVMQAVFPEFEYRPGEKKDWLYKFKEQGYYLIDATDRPVNRLSSAERRSELKSAVQGKLDEIRMLIAPTTPIVLVKKNIFVAFNRPLRDAGFNVIHASFLPFPSHGHQARFVEACRECLRRARGE